MSDFPSRQRTESSASEPSGSRHRHRRRTTSILSTISTQSNSKLLNPKSPASVLPARPGTTVALGSFAPTGSATTTLRYLVSPSSRRRQLQPLWLETYSDSPSSSGPPSPLIPSISRTASPPYVISPTSSRPSSPDRYSHPHADDEYVKHPSLISHLRRRSEYPVAPHPRPANTSSHTRSQSEMHPILARLERQSKLCKSKTQCATCGETGADFPRCGKCNQMWCSRECRLTGGKRHVCRSSIA